MTHIDIVLLGLQSVCAWTVQEDIFSSLKVGVFCPTCVKCNKMKYQCPPSFIRDVYYETKIGKNFVHLCNYVRMIPPQNKTCLFYVNRRFLSSHNFVINSRDMKAMKLFWVAIYFFFQVNKCFYIEKKLPFNHTCIKCDFEQKSELLVVVNTNIYLNVNNKLCIVVSE